jgi:PAS domain S-box-containing protein
VKGSVPEEKVAGVDGGTAGGDSAPMTAFAGKVIETAPVGLLTYDAAGQCVQANETAASAFGATVEQLLAQSFRRVESWKTTGLLAAAEETLATGRGRRLDAHVTTSFGRDAWLDFRLEAFGTSGERHLLVAVNDLTNLKQAEDRALQDSQQKYRELFENSRVGMYRTKIDGSAILELNRALCELLGSPREKLLNRSSLISWADPAVRTKVVELLRANGSVTDYEIEILRDNGEHLHCLISMRLHADEGYIEGSIVDITARKRAEKELAESEARYRSLYGNAQVGMYRSRLDGTAILAVNRKLCEIFGYTEEEMVGNPATIRWADPAARERMIAELRNAGALRDHEMDILTKSGEVRTCLVSVQLHPAQGYLEGSAVDITARKRAEEALREAKDNLERRVRERTSELAAERRFFRQVIDTVPAFVCVKTEAGPYALANASLARAYGTTVSGVEGKTDRDFSPTPEEESAFRKDDLEVIHGRRIKTIAEEPITYADGTVHWYSTTKIPIIDPDGSCSQVLVVAMDITELREHREHLEELVARRTDELATVVRNLARSNQELEQFAYVASHDLQEPLRMISSYTQLLAQRYGEQLDDKAKKYIAYAVDGAIRLQGQINDLLTYSRVSTRGKPIESVDSHSALGEAIRNLTAAIEESQTLVVNDDLPTVRADAAQLVLVFQNLIANAIKFRSGESPRVHVTARDDGGAWVFSVKDNGIGIDPKYAERLFVIFQRLHTRAEYPGSGIGLAICKRIVERHGGRIWFESELGKGSTFFFTVPK